MEPEPLLHREELTATLFTIADINQHVERILFLLEEWLDGEEGPQEDS
jgi:hypothetical protein